MILKNRLFERKEPSKDAKLFIIFCEGKKREPDYFNYFNQIESRIKLEPIPPKEDGDNSPTGLYNEALKIIGNNHESEYDIEDVDEIWFVIDTDKWEEKIEELRTLCGKHNNYFIAQSNPCFEVWLYFHLHDRKPDFAGVEKSSNWKSFLNSEISGGFDSRKHPLFIKKAIENSKNNYIRTENDKLDIPYTEVFKLAERFYPLVKSIIEKELKKLEDI